MSGTRACEPVVEPHKATCKGYRDYRELLQQKDLDAVIIATPPHWHALQAIAACEAGKDIYLQKPMTLHLAESFAVRNAVNRHQRICQVGTQIHASENYRRVVEYIRSGNLGPIGTVRTFNVMNQHPDGVGKLTDHTAPEDLGLDWNLWCGPAPLRDFNRTLARDAYYHCSWMDYSGGWTPGMAPHIIDLPVWALDLGFPTQHQLLRRPLRPQGRRRRLRPPRSPLAIPEADHDLDVLADQQLRLRLPRRTQAAAAPGHLFPRRQRHPVCRLRHVQDRARRRRDERQAAARPQSIPPSPGHEREWLDCIKSRQQPSCNPNYHVRVDVPIRLSLLSLKLGRSIRFDPAAEKIVGDPEAARLAIPKYRAPWKFPKQYLKA